MIASNLSFKGIISASNAREYTVKFRPAATQAPLLAALTAYIELALQNAHYEYIDEDHLYYGDIPGFAGVYASSEESQDDCARELQEVLQDWIVLRLEQGKSLPPVQHS